MFGLRTVLPTLLATAAVLTTAHKNGTVTPCHDGQFDTPNDSTVVIYCNTSLADYKYPDEYMKKTMKYPTFNDCVNGCYGDYVASDCCAAAYIAETEKCTLVFSQSSVCTTDGRHFVGAANDTSNLVVLHQQ